MCSTKLSVHDIFCCRLELKLDDHNYIASNVHYIIKQSDKNILFQNMPNKNKEVVRENYTFRNISAPILASEHDSVSFSEYAIMPSCHSVNVFLMYFVFLLSPFNYPFVSNANLKQRVHSFLCKYLFKMYHICNINRNLCQSTYLGCQWEAQ